MTSQCNHGSVSFTDNKTLQIQIRKPLSELTLNDKKIIKHCLKKFRSHFGLSSKPQKDLSRHIPKLIDIYRYESFARPGGGVDYKITISSPLKNQPFWVKPTLESLLDTWEKKIFTVKK